MPCGALAAPQGIKNRAKTGALAHNANHVTATEVRRHQQGLTRGCKIQHRAARFARLFLILAKHAVPLRLIDLGRMVNHIAHEQRRLVLA